MIYTVDDLIWWLRNGNNGDPFLDPEDIYKADPTLEVNYWFKDDDHVIGDVTVIDPKSGFYLIADLDDDNQVIWEDWKIVHNQGLT